MHDTRRRAPPVVRTLLVRGMLVGLIAGLLVFGFGKVFGEPQVDGAITFETALDQAQAKAHTAMGAPPEIPEPELVSRPVQAGLGLFTGVMVYSTAFGGLFALVFACANGRVGRLSPRAVSALLGLGGFVAITVIPELKYPANPPSVGDAETIGIRTALYFLMLAVSIAAMVGAIVLRQRLAPRYGAWNAGLKAAAAYIVVIAVAQLLLPPVNEVPAEFPAVVLWNFRIASVGMQAIMWTTLGLLFGALTQRAMTVQPSAPMLHRRQGTGR
jgi:predicted cobalt transporter CbtA